MPMTKLPAQGREYMPKITTIDHTGVLEMALVGYELKRNRIEAAIAEIQAELGQGGSSRSTFTVTASIEPKPTRKKRFSAEARKRMAAAQKKRWAALKAKKAPGEEDAAYGSCEAPEGYGCGTGQETARPGEGSEEGRSEREGGSEGRSEANGQEGGRSEAEGRHCHPRTAADHERATGFPRPGDGGTNLGSHH